MGVLARLGVGPVHLLTTHRPRTVPVVPVDREGTRWLVAPYGPVGWVRDVRADRRIALRHGRTTRRYTAREASRGEAGPVLRRYVQVASKTRRHFAAAPGAPPEEFAEEWRDHPVFALTPDQPGGMSG
ncbi:MAG: nitroreductase family deazaflavin-dependent oxidoreductase [Thermoleophilia bacterium]|nr:nitroreductase family deazaflavin-dependent oxidoreductase [Thermoleophilia bacterium]